MHRVFAQTGKIAVAQTRVVSVGKKGIEDSDIAKLDWQWFLYHFTAGNYSPEYARECWQKRTNEVGAPLITYKIDGVRIMEMRQPDVSKVRSSHGIKKVKTQDLGTTRMQLPSNPVQQGLSCEGDIGQGDDMDDVEEPVSDGDVVLPRDRAVVGGQSLASGSGQNPYSEPLSDEDGQNTGGDTTPKYADGPWPESEPEMDPAPASPPTAPRALSVRAPSSCIRVASSIAGASARPRPSCAPNYRFPSSGTTPTTKRPAPTASPSSVGSKRRKLDVVGTFDTKVDYGVEGLREFILNADDSFETSLDMWGAQTAMKAVVKTIDTEYKVFILKFRWAD